MSREGSPNRDENIKNILGIIASNEHDSGEIATFRGQILDPEYYDTEDERANLNDDEIAEIAGNPSLIWAMYNFFTGKIREGEAPPSPFDSYETAKKDLEEQATKIQAAWRGYLTRRDLVKRGIKLKEELKETKGVPAKKPSKKEEEDLAKQLQNGARIMDRVMEREELSGLDSKEEKQKKTRKYSALLQITGDTDNNGIPGAQYQQDKILMDKDGLITAIYDPTEYSIFRYQSAIDEISSTASNDRRAEDEGTCRLVEFSGRYPIDLSYKTGGLAKDGLSEGGTYLPRPAELIYVQNGKVIRHIGIDNSKFKEERTAFVAEKNAASGLPAQNEDLLPQVIDGTIAGDEYNNTTELLYKYVQEEIDAEAQGIAKGEIEPTESLIYYLEELGIEVDTETKKITPEQYQEASAKDPDLLTKIKLEVKVSHGYIDPNDIPGVATLDSKSYYDQLSNLEECISATDLSKISPQHRKKLTENLTPDLDSSLNAVRRHKNRGYEQQFVQERFAVQQASLQGQKETLAEFRKALIKGGAGSLPKKDVFKDFSGENMTFPIAGHGVTQSIEFVPGHDRTKIAKVSFNSTQEEGIDPNLEEQFIRIPGTCFHKRVMHVPPNSSMGLFTYKNGKRTEIEPSEEDRSLIDENTAWRKVKVAIRGTSPTEYTITYKPYKVFPTHPLDGIRDLRRDIVRSEITVLQDLYEKMALEVTSSKDGQILSAARQSAGVSRNIRGVLQSSTKSITLSQALKKSLEEKAVSLYKREYFGSGVPTVETAEEMAARKTQLKETFAHLEKIADIRFKEKGSASRSYYKNVLNGAHGYYSSSNSDVLGFVPVDVPWGTKEKTTAIDHVGKIFDHEFSANMAKLYGPDELLDRPDIREFSRQVAIYSVEAANHDWTESGRKGFFASVFLLVDQKLNEKGIATSPEDREALFTLIQEDIKTNATAKGQKYDARWFSMPKGYGKMADIVPKAKDFYTTQTTAQFLKKETVAIRALQQLDGVKGVDGPEKEAAKETAKAAITEVYDSQKDKGKKDITATIAKALTGEDLPDPPYITRFAGRTDAVVQMAKIFDTDFSTKMAGMFGSDDIESRLDISEFARSIAHYAVEAANQKLFQSTREDFFKDILKVASDQLDRHDNTRGVDKNQFKDLLQTSVNNYAEQRSQESWFPKNSPTRGYLKMPERSQVGFNKAIPPIPSSGPAAAPPPRPTATPPPRPTTAPPPRPAAPPGAAPPTTGFAQRVAGASGGPRVSATGGGGRSGGGVGASTTAALRRGGAPTSHAARARETRSLTGGGGAEM